MSVATFTKSGTKATTAARLSKDVFGIEVKNHELLKQAYLTHQANSRSNLAKTKKRGEVSGGGKKPWKQKGTGRARFGSSRVPIWRGGGIVFGPTGQENYSRGLNTSAKRTAVRQALSLSAKDGKLIIIESIDMKEASTAKAAALMSKLGSKGRTIVAVEVKTPELTNSFANLADTKLVTATYLNVFDLLNADTIIMTNDALKAVHNWLGKKAEAK
jgi:large subunit ribosomal protein L4